MFWLYEVVFFYYEYSDCVSYGYTSLLPHTSMSCMYNNADQKHFYILESLRFQSPIFLLHTSSLLSFNTTQPNPPHPTTQNQEYIKLEIFFYINLINGHKCKTTPFRGNFALRYHEAI